MGAVDQWQSFDTVSQRPWVRLLAALPFFCALLPFQKSLDSNGKIRALIRPWLISLWTWLIGVPTTGLPAVIPLKILCIVKLDWCAYSCVGEAHLTKACSILHHLWWLCGQTLLCSWGMVCNPEAVHRPYQKDVPYSGWWLCVSICVYIYMYIYLVAGLAAEVWELRHRPIADSPWDFWRLIHRTRDWAIAVECVSMGTSKST